VPITKTKPIKLAVVSSSSSNSGGLDSKYQILFDQASDAIVLLSSDGRIDSANQAMEELTGFLKSELLHSSVDMLKPDPANLGRTRPISIDLLSEQGTFEDVAIKRKDGYTRYIDLSVRRVDQGDNQITIALFRDVTEKKRMERELITKHTELRNAYFQLEKKNAEMQALQETLVQAGKMAALGELAAGIAHELNQPLQGIRGYAQELQELAVPLVKGNRSEAEIGVGFREIISNVDKMAGIIGYLRTFTRKSTEDFEFTDIHHAIEESLKMLSRQFAARGIQVERKFGTKLPQVYSNPLQLEQVFINLATNARDAIEATSRGSGKVSISTTHSAGFIEVYFRDDGIGMNDRTKAKMFNPFFTTKEVGKGMGLGLSLSYGILSKLHGSIVVETELGKGTAFLIKIPCDFREMG